MDRTGSQLRRWQGIQGILVAETLSQPGSDPCVTGGLASLPLQSGGHQAQLSQLWPMALLKGNNRNFFKRCRCCLLNGHFAWLFWPLHASSLHVQMAFVPISLWNVSFTRRASRGRPYGTICLVFVVNYLSSLALRSTSSTTCLVASPCRVVCPAWSWALIAVISERTPWWLGC